MTALAGEARVVAEGLGFPEGPVALGDGTVACVEMQGQRITRAHPDGSTEVLAELGGGPNGATLGADGHLYVANNGGLSVADDGSYWWAPETFDGRVQRVLPGRGAETVHDSDLPGPAPHRPNDLCAGPDGALYVTDSGNWEQMKELREGSILRVDASGDVTVAAGLAAMPNGILALPDGSGLLVVQSLTRRIWRFPFVSGSLGESTEVCRLPQGIPDGMALADDGRLFVCASVVPEVVVFDAAGEVIGGIPTGAASQPTNCCLHDGTLYVTLARHGQLVAFDVDAAPAASFSAGWVGA